MCGLAGIWQRRGRTPVRREDLVRMRDTIAYRGPDAADLYLEPTFGLGHCRLAVIDLSGGHQPMSSADGRFVIAFNGELYNFRELKAQHLRGVHCRTASDTEVLLELFARYGEACLPWLNGMFAFAVWDRADQTLTLARDRFGKKPLYYADLGDTFLFGSEPKALLAHPRLTREPDPEALVQYLLYEYVPGVRSAFRQIRRVPPASRLRVTTEDMSLTTWWNLPTAVPDRMPRPAADILAEADALLSLAVRRRLIADVPLGLFLSGGIDSSLVGWYMRQHQGDVRSLSMSFDEPTFDESRYARLAAQHLQTRHTDIRFGQKEFGDACAVLDAMMDEPFADASILPTIILSQYARRDMTVALTGDGGDELLYGYNTFLALQLSLVYDAVPRSAQRLLAALLRLLPTRYTYFSREFQAKMFVRGAAYPVGFRNQVWIGSFALHELQELLAPEWQSALVHLHDPLIEVLARIPPATDPLAALGALFQSLYLPDDILVKADRAMMFTALEGRSPLLDPAFADFLWTLPTSWKYARGQGKVLFRRLMRGRLPETILWRAKKGFGIPLGLWMRTWLRPTVEATLARDRLELHGTFRPAAVNRLLAEHMAGRMDHRKKLWTLMMFQRWWERWITGRPVEDDVRRRTRS